MAQKSHVWRRIDSRRAGARQKSRLVGEGGANTLSESSPGYRRYPRDCTDCSQSERYLYPTALSIEMDGMGRSGGNPLGEPFYSCETYLSITRPTDKGRAGTSLLDLPAPSAAGRSPQNPASWVSRYEVRRNQSCARSAVSRNNV